MAAAESSSSISAVMGRIRLSRARVVDLDVNCKTAVEAEEKQRLLETELSEISAFIREHESNHGHDDDDEPSFQDEAKALPADKIRGWEKRKVKYDEYIHKGKHEKLRHVKERQEAKLAKAKQSASVAEKPYAEAYIAYKQAKVDYTTGAIKAAMLVHNMNQLSLKF